MNYALPSILNGYDKVRQQAEVAGGILGPDLDGVLPIDELRSIEIEVEGRLPPVKVGISNARGMSDTHQVTLLMAEWAKGNERASDDLTPLVYRELRQLAASYLGKERQGHTLEPTALCLVGMVLGEPAPMGLFRCLEDPLGHATIALAGSNAYALLWTGRWDEGVTRSTAVRVPMLVSTGSCMRR